MVFLELSGHVRIDSVSLCQPDSKSKNSALEYLNPLMYRELLTVITAGKILAVY